MLNPACADLIVIKEVKVKLKEIQSAARELHKWYVNVIFELFSYKIFKKFRKLVQVRCLESVQNFQLMNYKHDQIHFNSGEMNIELTVVEDEQNKNTSNE